MQKNKIVINVYTEREFYNNKHEVLVYEGEKDNPVENQSQKIMYQLIVIAEQIYAGDIVKNEKLNELSKNVNVCDIWEK